MSERFHGGLVQPGESIWNEYELEIRSIHAGRTLDEQKEFEETAGPQQILVADADESWIDGARNQLGNLTGLVGFSAWTAFKVVEWGIGKIPGGDKTDEWKV